MDGPQLGVLCLHAETLRALDMEGILRCLQHLPDQMDIDALFAAIAEIKITPASFERRLRAPDSSSSASSSGNGRRGSCAMA